MFGSGIKRRTFSRRQAMANEEKRKQSQRLVGKKFIHNGIVCEVREPDFMSGEAMVRMRGRDEAYHPAEVERMYLANPLN